MNKLLFAFVGVMLASTFPDTSAQALNQRSWVSSTGSGTTCTRASPCANFQTAHNATNAGGAIHCVDGADYSAGATLTITKSLTIDCAGTQGIHGRDISVNGANIVVHLRNLLVDGGAVNFDNGDALYIENCTISGGGIAIDPPNGVTAKLVVLDSTIVGNLISSGILIAPAASAVARVSIARTKIAGNQFGIFADGTFGGLVSAVIKDSYIANNIQTGVALLTNAGAGQASVTMDHSASVGNGTVGNGGDGIQSSGSKSYAVLTDSTVIANFGTGLRSVSGGYIFSYGNNAVTGNVTDANPTNFFNLK